MLLTKFSGSVAAGSFKELVFLSFEKSRYCSMCPLWNDSLTCNTINHQIIVPDSGKELVVAGCIIKLFLMGIHVHLMLFQCKRRIQNEIQLLSYNILSFSLISQHQFWPRYWQKGKSYSFPCLQLSVPATSVVSAPVNVQQFRKNNNLGRQVYFLFSSGSWHNWWATWFKYWHSKGCAQRKRDTNEGCLSGGSMVWDHLKVYKVGENIK